MVHREAAAASVVIVSWLGMTGIKDKMEDLSLGSTISAMKQSLAVMQDVACRVPHVHTSTSTMKSNGPTHTKANAQAH